MANFQENGEKGHLWTSTLKTPYFWDKGNVDKNTIEKYKLNVLTSSVKYDIIIHEVGDDL